jgi:zinc transport system ATP-binding protein
VSAAPDGETLLRTEGLVVGWRGRPLLPPIDVALRRRRLVVVAGRNGAGKTTWFKTLLGLTAPIAGRVTPAHAGLRFGYVPQSTSLEHILPLRARDVVMQGRLRGWSFLRPLATRGDRDAAARALADAGAADLGGATFRDLSKGERQRVLFARLLAAEADLCLLDEPTAAMDAEGERRALERLASLAHDGNAAVVVVTHALDLVMPFADDLLLFDRVEAAVTFGERDAVLGGDAYRRYQARAAAVSGRGTLAREPSEVDG